MTQTIEDVRERVGKINRSLGADKHITFCSWSKDGRCYQLQDADTGESYGPICTDEEEFIKVVRSFRDGYLA